MSRAIGGADRVLDGDRPIFIVHRPHQHADQLARVLPAIINDFGGDLLVGTTMNLPFYTPKQVAQYFSVHAQVPIRIADPSLYAAPNAPWPSDPPTQRKRVTDWSYMTTVPDRVGAPWVRSVMDQQIQAGASVLLSANGWVEAVDPRNALARAMQFADESSRHVQGYPYMVGLTLDATWLSDPRLRSRILQEILESNHRHWHLRILWPIVKPSYSQLRDTVILDGYRELAELCASEGKVLVLPNTSLSGWVMTALGATGFSTGRSSGEQAFARSNNIRLPKGRLPLARVFDPALLHTVEFSEFLRLEGFAGHLGPANEYIREMLARGHDVGLAGCHYLYETARLQSAMSSPQKSEAARDRVTQSEMFVEGLRRPDQPAGANRPQHLPIWQSLLA